MAVKPGKPKPVPRIDVTSRVKDPRKTSRPPGAASRPPQPSRPPQTSRTPTARPPNMMPSRSSRPRPLTERQARDGARSSESSQPEISLHREPVGRDTLAAIDEELARELPKKHRPPMDTLDYEERPRAPGVSRPPQGSSPDVITIGEAPMGRETLAAIDEELALEARVAMAQAAPTLARAATTHAAASAGGRSATTPRTLAAPAPADIFEISTFIVEGEEIFSKASNAARRDFVEQRLLHRLPVRSMADVVRIDLSRGAAANTMILRVWSKVGDPRG